MADIIKTFSCILHSHGYQRLSILEPMCTDAITIEEGILNKEDYLVYVLEKYDSLVKLSLWSVFIPSTR